MEAPPGIGPGIKVLQTSALPLGYGAIKYEDQRDVRYEDIRKLRLPESPGGGGEGST